MNVIESPYGLDEPGYRSWWLGWRRLHCCSTDTVSLAGCGYESSGGPVSRYLDKKGMIPDSPPTEEQATGTYLEPHIANLCEQRFGVHFVGEQVLVEHPTKPWIGASLDRVTSEEEIWELKSIGNPREMMGLDLNDGNPETLPERILVQVHHQMIAAEADHVIVACLVGNRIGRFHVPRNEQLIEVLSVLIDEFWDHVVAGIAPEDFRAGDAAIIQRAFQGDAGYAYLGDHRLAEAAATYIELGPQIKSLEQARDVEKAKLLLAIGDHRTAELADGTTLKKSVTEVQEKQPRKYTRTSLYVKKSRVA